MYSVIGLYIAFGLLALAFIAIVISAFRGLIMNAMNEIKKISIFLIPVIVFIVSYFVANSVAGAGIATLFIMIAIMAASMILTGLKSTFNF